jgi:hypothetical protein
LPQISGLKNYLLITFLIFCVTILSGQEPVPAKKDTEAIKRSTSARAFVDSVNNADASDSASKDTTSLKDSIQALKANSDSSIRTIYAVWDTSSYRKFQTHPYLPWHQPAIYMLSDLRKQADKDYLFYLLSGIVFLLAFIRMAFDKYFRKMFQQFFQTALRQKQTRDQLLQDNLASLLTNLLFVASAGLYITLVIQNKNWIQVSFWWLAAGSAAVLLVTYAVKYLFLLFAGWVFNAKEATGSYAFVVFQVNKVMGVLLVPFIWILAYSQQVVIEVAITISVGIAVILLIYRYWVSYLSIQNKLKVNALHFLLYLCAVELLPLLLIYKVLLNYLDGSF